MRSIIGCGNTNRRDDGVGIFVVHELMKHVELSQYKDLRIFDAGTSGIEVMFQARGSNSLIIIDANKSDSEAGTIFKVPGEELESLPQPSYNLHDFRWDHAIYAGKQIYKDEFPKDITVYLIEAEDLDYGLDLSPVVQKAAERVVELIVIGLGTMPFT